MGRYSAQFRSNVLKKLLPPNGKSVAEVAKEFNLSTGTIYSWKGRMKDGTLSVDDGMQSNRSRQMVEKFSLLLEARGLAEEERGTWLRENGLHSEHLSIWEQEVMESMTKGEKAARDELKAARKALKDKERELNRKDKALAEMAAIITLQKKTSLLFQDQEED